MKLQPPELMATLQVVGVQNLPGRIHEHVRVFGHRPENAEMLFEVALTPNDAYDLIAYAQTEGEFPEIEIAERHLVRILSTRGVDIIHMNQQAGDPPVNPSGGA